MPTYEYECSKCKECFEKFQGIKDAPIKYCPKCGAKVYRLIGMGSAVIFKGSGFYQTDYKNRVPSDAGGKDKKSAKDNKPCPEAKSKGCEGCSLNRGKDG
ncbi:MAG: zinc ribbon domain-containing protein [Candidatus Omnitrophota bacterium]|nr:zinc ribbon domain-containing protein [Candidatus Omnitrophota bacterium]